MKQRRLHLVLASATVLLALPSALRADIVVMKDGKKYENATILSDSAAAVTFKYMLTANIPDTRTEPKANVAQIIRQKPEELEIVPLRKVVPTPDLLTADKYESLIQDTLRPFVTKYAGTTQAKEVEEIIKTLQAEKEKVVSGSVKMEGEWITTEMVKRQGHSIDAYRVRRDMNALAAEGKIKEALSEWDKLTNQDDGFTDTLQYVKAIPEALGILEGYKKQLDAMMAAQPDLERRRKDSMSKMIAADPQLERTKSAIAAEVAKFKAETDIEKKSHVRWTSTYKYDLKSIQNAAKVVIDEMTKLRGIDLNKLTTQNEALVHATQFLADSNVDEAEKALAIATGVQLKGTNKAIQNLRTRINTLKAENNKKRNAQRIYGGTGNSALTGGAATSTDSSVAEAMAKVEKEKADKKAEKENPKAESENPKGGDAAGDADKTNKKDDKKTSKTKQRKLTPSGDTAKAPEEEGGIQKYLFMGGGGLLAVLLTVMFLQKRKNG